MLREATTMVRDYLSKHGDEFERIITAKDFSTHFTVLGDALKNVPKGYNPEHSQAEYLKYKSWFLEYPISDRLILDSEGFIHEATDIFALMKPFNNFLNKALVGFIMPTRK